MKMKVSQSATIVTEERRQCAVSALRLRPAEFNFQKAELRANIFAAIEEEDRSLESEENPTFALLGSCSERAKELHASPTGKLLTALVCDYLEWSQLEHTLKVYLPECNLPRGFWKSELKDRLGQKAETGSGKDGDLPLLVDIVESYLKNEQQKNVSNLTGSFTKLGVRRMQNDNLTVTASSDDTQADVDKVNPTRRSSSASLTGNLPPLGRKGGLTPIVQTRNSAASSRNLEVSSTNDHSGAEELVWKENKNGRLDIVESNGAANKIGGNKFLNGSDNDVIAKSPGDAMSVEKRQENQSENKSQPLNSFWRQKAAIGEDDASLESLEEVVEEEDASFEKESCSSVQRDSLEDLL
ncbi:hypothetical protein GOP47_0009614 [Adiantum capillus-veneris]|uniref:LisH domain-containing protein n=1 Tax=Adiantum capillus-veneris TaxID=13818 RepID=A0A9D4UWW3_ADICA|nr:hypothetical protein GOP47_0009614 [Adiantum capillus-veneris]